MNTTSIHLNYLSVTSDIKSKGDNAKYPTIVPWRLQRQLRTQNCIAATNDYFVAMHAKRICDGDDISDQFSELPIFVLCDRCYWCATYFDKARIPVGQSCPQ